MKEDLKYPEECYKIVGAAFEVYKRMGCGFFEGVYQDCLEIELREQNIPFRSQVELAINYREIIIPHTYRADLVCYDKILVELKAVSELSDEHRAQILNYLNASKMQLGLLINFGHYPKIQWERFVFGTELSTKDTKKIPTKDTKKIPTKHTK